MNGTDRRAEILKLLTAAQTPLAGSKLAKRFDVSRQVIVQDVALLRANGSEILSTNRGYILTVHNQVSRVFKVHHTDASVEDELFTIVDFGGVVKDVFVSHRVYGILRVDINIRSRQDARTLVEDIQSGRSSLLKNVTAGYHYHTVLADSERTLDLIQAELQKKGFLARLQDFEPVNFWREEDLPQK